MTLMRLSAVPCAALLGVAVLIFPPSAGFANEVQKQAIRYHSPEEFARDPRVFKNDENLARLDANPTAPRLSRMITLPLLNFYRAYISPAKGFHCPMYPSCSSYGKEAFSRHNPLVAFWKTSARLTRCGHDPERYGVVAVDGVLRYYDPVDP
jgi:putative component of membrane protein insertase Oxa1/YidC/SpoIIIJ protein YidD